MPKTETQPYTWKPEGGYIFGVPQPTPPASEPAVISSQSIDEDIAKGKTKLTEMSNKGTTVGNDGNSYYADNSLVPAPEGSTFNQDTKKYEGSGSSYGVAEFYGDNQDDAGDADYQAIKSMFEPLKAQLDANTLAQVTTIQQQFESLKRQQTEFNRRAETARSRALLLGGSSRYAPLDAAGTMMAQTSYGLQQIQDLDAKENMAIAQARSAQQSGNMELMMKAIDMAESTRKEKQDRAAKVMDGIQKANDKMREIRIKATRDEAVAGLITQGVTDPKQLIEKLNKYDDGTPTGGNFTAAEIDDALKAFTVEKKKASDVSTDLKTFEYIRDEIGLPPEIQSLPPEQQYFAYIAALHKSNTTPKAPGAGGGYSALELRKLRQAGIDPADTKSSDNFLYGDEGDQGYKPTWEEYLNAALKLAKVNYFPKADEALLREQYKKDYETKKEKFTSTENKRLEQAGLLGASRQEQLDYLFKKKGDDTELPDGLK